MVGERADAETIARLRKELHLDEPVLKHFTLYAGGFSKATSATLTSRSARSFATSRSDSRRRLLLAGSAMLLASISGITIGVLSAEIRGWFDRLSLGFAYLGISFPVYWVGLILILIFAVTLKWLPPSGYGGIKYLILPALALGSRSIAFLARVTRSAMLDVLSGDFVRTARAKGLKERAVVVRHALRNALIPIVTVPRSRLWILSDRLDSYRNDFLVAGIGRYVVNAISRRDLRRSTDPCCS
jgi:ABC-type dipeptide/oligopeptide/nickel transport system permease component